MNKFKYVIFPDRDYTFRIDGEDVEISGEELFLVAINLKEKKSKMNMLSHLGFDYNLNIDSLFDIERQ